MLCWSHLCTNRWSLCELAMRLPWISGDGRVAAVHERSEERVKGKLLCATLWILPCGQSCVL
jgi:hypothetical protein